MWIHRSRDRDLLDFYAKTQMGRAFLMSRRFGVVIIVEHRMNLFLCPHPPSSTPDRYQTPRVFGVSSNPSTFLDDFPRSWHGIESHTLEIACRWILTHDARKNEKKAASVLHLLRAKVRPFVADDRSCQRSPTEDRYGWGAKGRLPPWQRETLSAL